MRNCSCCWDRLGRLGRLVGLVRLRSWFDNLDHIPAAQGYGFVCRNMNKIDRFTRLSRREFHNGLFLSGNG